jgi:hypothetical protein
VDLALVGIINELDVRPHEDFDYTLPPGLSEFS